MRRALLTLGLLFLWAPVLLLAAYAFSDSRTPFEWGGFSLRWFGALARNERILEAAWLSLRVGMAAASLATLLGLALGWVLARHGPFVGRPVFGALAGAPLVLPEVVTGLALLLLFVGLQALTGWPSQRGAVTVWLAHSALGMAYVAVLVQARLAALDPRLEEAAADLGATSFVTFRTVTLPLIWPSLAAGWLLAFTLSLDDVVVASFVSGPGATTLPVYLFSQLRLGMTPEANALAVVLLGFASLAGAVAWAIRGRAG
ncbi:ABC transporter permease [Roseococcus pinisoli]|uniref:ABC transporter permease subunit n=1 Tax=Roseococcus pinisoli TaxID=2835040 RepID=A0ABS5QI11_9PROT|nr:ABC transporter permease subunit [Roseococcus pinisoli]MBS7813133.1 ABC transporter permease subunit [Roseococcus pinisoli]